VSVQRFFEVADKRMSHIWTGSKKKKKKKEKYENAKNAKT
jgi:hypothetical protein